MLSMLRLRAVSYKEDTGATGIANPALPQNHPLPRTDEPSMARSVGLALFYRF
jgi:hypothetical protein